MAVAMNKSLNCSLTSLNWLQKLGCRSSGLARPLATAATQRQVVQQIFPTQKERLAAEKKRKQALKAATNKAAAALKAASGGGGSKGGKSGGNGINWNANSTEKPPHCYATLIYMAMRSLRKEKVTLGEIYTFVKSNFLYYRTNDNGWKNSIRHNLTQHACFVKVQRTDEHPGKGGYWQLSPDYEAMFQNGIFKRKRRKIGGSQFGTNSIIKQTGNTAGKPSKRKPIKLKVSGMSMPFKWPAGLEDIPGGGGGGRGRRGGGGGGIGSSSLSTQIPEEIEHLEGIDWDNMIPEIPGIKTEAGEGGGGEPLSDPFGGSGGDGSSMLNALTLMDGTASAGSPISILPDINQNDGSGTPEGPSYTLNELHDEIDYGLKPQHLSIQQQIKQVESTLDLSGNIEEIAKMDSMSWNGQDLTVRGIGLSLVEGVVPSIDTKVLQYKYNHITPDDLHDLDMAPMPSDWII